MKTLEELGEIATGRSESLFQADLEASHERLRERIEGRRLLVIGAAGSIGGSTLREALRFRPAHVDAVDVSENGLAELVRDLRSAEAIAPETSIRFLPLDYGSAALERVILEAPPYDLALHFAALKHVRSEKDRYSLLQMIDTNIVKQANLLRLLQGRAGRFFAVSTDKAANPVNLMGATKRFMEALLFGETSGGLPCTSARFANVAFSNGSLLAAWPQRLMRRQPIAVPTGTRRFFVSLAESGQICLLASVLGRPGRLMVPALHPSEDLKLLEEVAGGFLRAQGLEPMTAADESEAIRLAADPPPGRYPLLLTPLDTSGEKPYEEFVADDEEAEPTEFTQLHSVQPARLDSAAVSKALAWMESAVRSADVPASEEEIAGAFAQVLPTFQHARAQAHLDSRI